MWTPNCIYSSRLAKDHRPHQSSRSNFSSKATAITVGQNLQLMWEDRFTAKNHPACRRLSSFQVVSSPVHSLTNNEWADGHRGGLGIPLWWGLLKLTLLSVWLTLILSIPGSHLLLTGRSFDVRFNVGMAHILLDN